MLQILHIFRKDGRRHWPEILASLLLLGLYVHLNLRPWQPSSQSFFLARLFSLRGTITPVLILFWCFLILRVIQSENLVGDRQWWVTKPYVWWKLLIAKLLFVLLVICVPLLFTSFISSAGTGSSSSGTSVRFSGCRLVLPSPSFSQALLSAH
jgi:hypothetical protein